MGWKGAGHGFELSDGPASIHQSLSLAQVDSRQLKVQVVQSFASRCTRHLGKKIVQTKGRIDLI